MKKKCFQGCKDSVTNINKQSNTQKYFDDTTQDSKNIEAFFLFYKSRTKKMPENAVIYYCNICDINAIRRVIILTTF